MAGKILVVDDVATNRIILKAKLGIACYDVVQASDGPAALELAVAERPDLILLDLAMPGMSGLDVLRALKSNAQTAQIPVVIVSAQVDRRSRLAALQAGAEDYLAKPVDDMLLPARVRSLLRARLITDELDLRDGTRRALGFSEAQAPFAAPPIVGPRARGEGGSASASSPSRRLARPGRIALINLGKTPIASVEQAAHHMEHDVLHVSRAKAMRLARGASIDEAEYPGGRTAQQSGNLPEAFVIVPNTPLGHDGMMLLSELRANPSTNRAAIAVITPAEDQAQAAMALDLGASDVLTLSAAPEEVALRLSRQIDRTRRDATARRRLRDGLQLAITDPLTGLPNRRFGLSHLDRMLERSVDERSPLSVMMLDLDRFKQVNDRFGHAAGDAVLRAVATRLKPQLRGMDVMARLGGEEFLVILPDTPHGDALKTAERLRRALDAIPIAVGIPATTPCAKAERQAEVHQTLSIGLASGPTATERDAVLRSDVASATAVLLERADAALMRAKSMGRNRVVRSLPGRHGEAAA